MARNKSTLIYLLIAVGLVCYLALVDKKIPGTKEEEDSDNELFKFDVADVTGLEVNNVHGIFIFKKKGDRWEIKSPIDAPADKASVEEVINQIAYAQPQRVIHLDGGDKGTAAKLKEWGLAPAAERAIIHTPSQTYELLVGRKMAINDSVYSRTSGRKSAPVRIIPNTIKTVLEKDLSDFRSRNVFDFDSTKAIKIASRVSDTPTQPAQECEIDLKDKKWNLQRPLVARASETDVQGLLTRILALHVVDFITDAASNLSSYGLTSPSATLSVTVQPQEELQLQIGAPVPNKPDQVYAQRLGSNSVFSLAKSAVDSLLLSLPNVRDLHVLPFDPAKADGFSLSYAKKIAAARSSKGVWNTTGSFAGRADVGKLTDIFARLSQLQTTPVLKDSAPDLKPFGLDKPQGKISIHLPGNDQSLSLLIGKMENKLLYVQNSAEPFIYTVPASAFDFLPASNLALLDGRAINLKLSQVTGMTITAPPAPPVILLRSLGGTWSATNVKDRMVDSIKADTQASLFCQLQAQTWLGPVQPSYGLAKPILTISMANGPSHVVLRVGATQPDGSRAAQVEGNSTAFSISEGDFGILNSSSIQEIPKVVTGLHAPSSPPPLTSPKTK